MRKLIFLILGVIFLVVVGVVNNYEKNTYPVTTPYYCPIDIEAEEWKNLKSLEEKIAVCEIPEEILKEMTTKALVESVVACPLMVNIFAHNTIEFGYYQVKGYYNGLDELSKRNDAKYELENYLKNIDANDTLTVFIVETLIKYI